MLELLLEIVGEILLQLIAELGMEFGLHSVAEPFRRKPRPWLAACAYVLLGMVFGVLSLFVVPDHLTPASWRVVNLVVAPVIVGVVMAMMGRWRERRDETVFRIDRFACGYLFALTFALVRFLFAA